MAKKLDLTPQWTADDRQALRDFLSKCPNFIPFLASERPKPKPGANAEDKKVLGLEIAQHFTTIETIQEMASDSNPGAHDLES